MHERGKDAATAIIFGIKVFIYPLLLFLLVPPQYNRYYYCYKTAQSGEPPIPSIEGQDPLLTGPVAYRQKKVQACAKASTGRGYRYFALYKGGECLSGPDAEKTYNKYGNKVRKCTSFKWCN